MNILKIKFPDLILLLFTTIAFLSTYYYGWWSGKELFTFNWWSGSEQIGYWYPIILLIFCALIRLLKISYLKLALFILVMFYISVASFSPIITIGLLWFTAYLIGKYIIKICNIKSINNKIIISAAGFSVIGLFATIISHFPLSYPQSYLIVFLCINFFIYRELNIGVSQIKLSIENISLAFTNLDKNINLFFGIALVSVLFHLFLLSLMPDMGHDSLSTHLTVPRFIAENHYWKYDINEFIWSVQPMGGDMLNVPVYMFGGQDGIRLLNISFLIGVGVLIFQHSLDLLKSINISAGFALAFLSTPIIYYVMGSSFIEPSFLFFSACFIYLLFSKKIEWTLVSIVLGFAISIKFSAIFFIPLICIIYYIDIKDNNISFSYIRLIKILLILLSFCSISYIYAIITTGNPFFPLINEIFKSPFYTSTAFYNPTWANQDGFKLFWTFIFNSKKYGEFITNGTLGIFLAVFIPSVLIIRLYNIKKDLKLTLILFIFILFLAIMFQRQVYLRYIIPALPIVYFVAISSLNIDKINSSILITILSIVIGINFIKSTTAASAFRPAPLEFYLSNQARQNFLASQLPYAAIGELLKVLPDFKNKKILLIGYAVDPLFYYFPNGTVAHSWHSLSVYDSINKNKGDISDVIKSMGIEFIVCPSEINSNDTYKFAEQCRAKTIPVIVTSKVYVGKVPN
jgi:hypothetical protein